jgi:hypothetical protein
MPVQFLIKKLSIFFSAVNIFQYLVIKILDPDCIRIRIEPKMLDPDPDQTKRIDTIIGSSLA